MAAAGAQVTRYQDDDDAQVDGEDDAPFGRSMRGQPWVRMGGMSPWHMWGNTQTLVVPVRGSGQNPPNETQLVKIAYKRPETWHWLLSARLISGPENTPGFFTRILVYFDLIVGIGRSVQRLQNVQNVSGSHSFDFFNFQWGPVNPSFPEQAHIWATQTNAPLKDFQGDTPSLDPGTPIAEIVAENIQLQARVLAQTIDLNVAALGGLCTIEVSAAFAPKTHIRPDWLQLDAPPEAQFAGEELAGR
jgi:hypothetical protein